MNKNLSRIYIPIIIIIYAHTKYKNMLITLGYFFTCVVLVTTQDNIFILILVANLHYAWKNLTIFFFKVKNENIK